MKLLVDLFMVEKKPRVIIFYKNYFKDFFIKQKDKVKDKIIWTLELIQELSIIPKNYLKHLEGTDGLYEIRIQQVTIFSGYSVFLIGVK